MSTKMSKEDVIKKLKSSGVLSDEMLSKLTGGATKDGPITTPTDVECPHCQNNVDNFVFGQTGEGFAVCGKCIKPFLVYGGKVSKINE